MLRSIFGLTAQILVVVGTSPTPMSSPPTTTVQAGPLGLNASYTPNSSRRSSPRNTMSAQAHISRLNKRLVHESVTRCVTRC